MLQSHRRAVGLRAAHPTMNGGGRDDRKGRPYAKKSTRTPREGGPYGKSRRGNKSQKFYLLFPGKWVTLSVLIF